MERPPSETHRMPVEGEGHRPERSGTEHEHRCRRTRTRGEEPEQEEHRGEQTDHGATRQRVADGRGHIEPESVGHRRELDHRGQPNQQGGDRHHRGERSGDARLEHRDREEDEAEQEHDAQEGDRPSEVLDPLIHPLALGIAVSGLH